MLLPVCLYFSATPTTELYTLSLHDALPILEALLTFVHKGNNALLATNRMPNILEDTLQFKTTYFNRDRKSTRLNSSHVAISYAVFCLKKKRNRSIRKQNQKARNATTQKQHG